MRASSFYLPVINKICVIEFALGEVAISSYYINMASSTSSKKSAAASHTLLQDLLGLGFLFLSLFTLLSLSSYTSTDPSFFTSARGAAKNLGGVMGSHWSSLLWQVLGASSFMLATIFLLSSIGLFRRIGRNAWLFASLNFFLLLISTAACFGLVQKPLSKGGSKFPMGGMLGDLLGGFLQSWLNTAGAALLSGCLLILAISLCSKISVRDIGLYIWLAVSKASVVIAGALLYVGMQIWHSASIAYSEMRPALVEGIQNAWEYLGELFRKEKDEKAAKPKKEKKSTEPAIITAKGEQKDELATVIPLRKKAKGQEESEEAEEELEENLSEEEDSDGPEIILNTHKASQMPLQFDPNEEMAESLGEKTKTSGLANLVKKAASANEKAIKGALGKKITYELPPLSFLNTPVDGGTKIDRDELLKNSKMLEEKFADFNVKGSVTSVKPGPVVTMYEYKPAPGVKVSAISNLSDDLALSLSAKSIRIVAPIPGRDVVGIEVPNRKSEGVLLKEVLGDEAFRAKGQSLPITIGKDIFGTPVVTDLKKMPHLLVAGTTGSGKSVFINTLICSLLYKSTPEDLNLILVDPKQLELAPYNDIPHLILPVVTEPKKASLALSWAVQEMERRYRTLAASVTRDQEGYNKKLDEIGAEKMEELLNKGKESFEERATAERMPKLVIIIDELADLMMTAKADVESNICRLAQKARAAGVHLVLATQRPSTDVITGLIKANLPSRICFRVSSKIDSRVMFDANGAEKLMGQGDMLFMPPGESTLLRMHGAYISVEEVDQITNFWRAQAKPNYREDILVDPEEAGEGGQYSDSDLADPIYQQALQITYESNGISASYLQRRLRIGYNKAARMVEMMEAQGIVGPSDGAKPRPLISPRPQP